VGGPINPPDKKGYRVVTISPNDDEAGRQLTAARDAGFEVQLAVYVPGSGVRVILENYGEEDS